MTLRLTVRRAAWEAHVGSCAERIDGLVPVVKGNGYGFGREVLHPVAAALSPMICVGTIHELGGVGAGVTPVVLTPSSSPPPVDAVLTVGSAADVAALGGWGGAVLVKLQSSMRRYGAPPSELDRLVDSATTAGLEVIGFALHLPLAGSDVERLTEVEAWLGVLDRAAPLWLSHLQPGSYAALCSRHPDRQFRLRLGTALWHGDKSFLHLSAEVRAVHQVRIGDRAGYRLHEVPGSGHVVMATAGSAHGVDALPGGASPFHFQHTRLALLEPPHMHTSMLFVPSTGPCPVIADRVDVQRPLITTLVDEIEWS